MQHSHKSYIIYSLSISASSIFSFKSKINAKKLITFLNCYLHKTSLRLIYISNKKYSFSIPLSRFLSNIWSVTSDLFSRISVLSLIYFTFPDIFFRVSKLHILFPVSSLQVFYTFFFQNLLIRIK